MRTRCSLKIRKLRLLAGWLLIAASQLTAPPLAATETANVPLVGGGVNAATYPTINEAVEAARGKTLQVTDKQVLTSNLTIPRDVALVILNGGSIEKAANAKLSINGPFSAGIYRVFSGFKIGDITFGTGSVKAAYPQWWGAKGDGDADSDDAPAINAAINSLAAGTVAISGDVFVTKSQITVKPGITLSGNGRTVIRAGGTIRKMVVLSGNAVADGLDVDGNSSFKNGRIEADGGEFGILALNSSHNTIRNCTVSRFRTAGIAIMAWSADNGNEAHYNTVEHCTVTSLDFVRAGEGGGGINIIIRSMYAGDDAEPLGGITRYNYAYGGKVTHNTVTGCTTLYGLHGVIVHNSRDNTICGNTMRWHSGSGIELDPKAIGTLVEGNRIQDCGGASINVAYGAKNTTIKNNTITGTHGSYNYAIGVFYGADNTVISTNQLDSRFDAYAGAENRAPGAGILIAQYCKNITINNNVIRGYRYGIWARTVMYPAVVLPTAPEYYLTGFNNLLVKNNIIQGAYVLSENRAHRLALPQNSLYGIWLNKNSTHDDITRGALPYNEIRVMGNLVDGVEYPYVVSESVATAQNPARFDDILFQNNDAVHCTSAAGLQNYAQYVNLQLSKYRGMNNSWNFIAKGTSVPPATALFGYGEKVHVTNHDATRGSVSEYIFSKPGIFKAVTMP